MMPRPIDEPRIEIAGPNAASVLLIGDGPVMGLGVTAHDLALPGHLARQLVRMTGRGVTVTCIADPHLAAANIEQRYAVFAPAELDAVVVHVGISDAIRVTRRKAWRSRLDRFITRLNDDSGGRVGVVLVGIPPVSTMPMLKGWRAHLAERRTPTLNRELQLVAQEHPNVEFLDFEPPREPDRMRYRSARTYSQWASLISPSVATYLQPSRPKEAPSRQTRRPSSG
jgi:hypothetical protein